MTGNLCFIARKLTIAPLITMKDTGGQSISHTNHPPSPSTPEEKRMDPFPNIDIQTGTTRDHLNIYTAK